jgi:SpoVK/Ycf46/Vps4 family AAA+-type ATPase
VQIRPSRGWSDLVLPADQREELHELVARHRHRETVHERWGFPAIPSPGLVALFAGPSGTGKTLAAEVVAAELGLDVYKVDLSAVVSKYIGETEKNLERIFSGASAGNAVLFFDEADALFGKRSDVGDAHDRYANIEVSDLLQRLESYPGMVVMATNLHKNMDAAFLRRIHVSVEFPMPDEEGRRAIWALSFPPTAPVDDIDLDFLARQFRISGGSIRGASLTAAFLAAEAGTPVTMELVVQGLKREFQKLGRLRTEAEFDRYFDLVREEPHAAPVG